MNKTLYCFSTVGVILITLYWPYSAYADVYISMSNEAEISIVNTSPSNEYSIRMIEPTIELTTNTATKKIRHNQVTQQLPYHSEVILAAQATSLDPALIHAIITVESKHKADAVSHKGALGLMQLMPATASRFNVNNTNDPKQNILAGSKYLRELLTLFNGNLKLTLAAYNAGPMAVLRYRNQIPPYKETMQYVPKVLMYYQAYSE